MTTQTKLAGIKPPNSDGQIFVRLDKVEDDGSVGAHLMLLNPGLDVAAYLALVDADLKRMGFPAVAQADADTIMAACAAAWTPEVIAAYQAKVQVE